MASAPYQMEHKVQDCFVNSHSHHEWFFMTPKLKEGIEALNNGAALEDAFDLAAKEGNFRHKLAGPIVRKDRVKTSYRMKFSWLDKRLGSKFWVPKHVDEELSWQNKNPLTNKQIRNFNAILQDPKKFAVSRSERFK